MPEENQSQNNNENNIASATKALAAQAFIGKAWAGITALFSSGYLWLVIAIVAIVGVVLFFAITYLNALSPVFTSPVAGTSCSSASTNAKFRKELEKIVDETQKEKMLAQFDNATKNKTSGTKASCSSTFNGKLAVPIEANITPEGTFVKVPGFTITSPWDSGRVVCISGMGCAYGHDAIDIGGAHGTRLVSVIDGKVTMATMNGMCGGTLKVQGADGISTLYCHLNAINVSVGDEVKAGQYVADLGTTGFSTGDHLHFNIKVNGVSVDPVEFYKSQGIDLWELYPAGR